MADQDLDARLSDTKEEEARETVQCACEQDGRTPEAEADDNAPVSLSDEEIGKVVGGTSSDSTTRKTAITGEWVKVNGELFQSSYGEFYMNQIKGKYKIQRYVPGRAAPYQLSPDVGWVKVSAITKVYKTYNKEG